MPRILCLLLHVSLLAAITVALPARRTQPADIFYVTEEVFGLTKGAFRDIAGGGSKASLLSLMRPKDRENFKRLQEQEGDGQAYNFVVEVIRKAFDVANNGQDKQEAFESIKDAYSDMKQQDKKTLLRFFKKFDGVFSKEHGRDPDSSEKEDIPDHSSGNEDEDEAQESLQRVEEILKKIEDVDSHFDVSELTASIEKLLRKSSKSWTANELKRVTRTFEKTVRQVLDDLDGASGRVGRSKSRQVDKIVQAFQHFVDVLDVKGFAQESAKRSLDRLVKGRRIDPQKKLEWLLDIIGGISFRAKNGKQSNEWW